MKNLQPVSFPPVFKFVCLSCEQIKTVNEKTRADLNGEPFQAYYCGECVEKLTREASAFPITLIGDKGHKAAQQETIKRLLRGKTP